MARQALGAGGCLLLSGAGTSGRLAVIEAAECWPTFSSDRVQALIAGGSQAFSRAQEGAEDDRAQGAVEARALNLSADDFFVGVAARGRTPYVWGTLEAAREAGAKTGILCCAAAAEPWVDLAIILATGPEALTGSTRLKAGTATKCVLNAITTGARPPRSGDAPSRDRRVAGPGPRLAAWSPRAARTARGLAPAPGGAW